MASDFVNTVKNRFPGLVFTLAVVNPGFDHNINYVNTSRTYKEVEDIVNWEMENVKNFYAYQLDPGPVSFLGWWSIEEWGRIFSQLIIDWNN